MKRCLSDHPIALWCATTDDMDCPANRSKVYQAFFEFVLAIDSNYVKNLWLFQDAYFLSTLKKSSDVVNTPTAG